MVEINELYSGILTSLHREKPHKTMDKKLIINVAPTGSFTNRQQNPGQPYTMEENVKAVVEAYKAGACVWHAHARDPNGLPSKDPAVMKETIARVLDHKVELKSEVGRGTRFSVTVPLSGAMPLAEPQQKRLAVDVRSCKEHQVVELVAQFERKILDGIGAWKIDDLRDEADSVLHHGASQ